jgi:hypothetical protein
MTKILQIEEKEQKENVQNSVYFSEVLKFPEFSRQNFPKELGSSDENSSNFNENAGLTRLKNV